MVIIRIDDEQQKREQHTHKNHLIMLKISCTDTITNTVHSLSFFFAVYILYGTYPNKAFGWNEGLFFTSFKSFFFFIMRVCLLFIE